MFFRLRSRGGSWSRHGLILSSLPMAWLAEGLEVAVFTAAFVGIFYTFCFPLRHPSGSTLSCLAIWGGGCKGRDRELITCLNN